MKVKIGNIILGTNDNKIMLIFEDGEKELIANMDSKDKKIVFAPEGSTEKELIDFMKGEY